jgi:hypothetical protein
MASIVKARDTSSPITSYGLWPSGVFGTSLVAAAVVWLMNRREGNSAKGDSTVEEEDAKVVPPQGSDATGIAVRRMHD